MYRIGGCPRCRGDQVYEPDTEEWPCMACGYRPPTVRPVYHETREMVGRGRLNAKAEVLGVGVQCRRTSPLAYNSQERSRHYDANRDAMEEEYGRICAARSKARTLPDLRQAGKALAEFHEYHGLDSARWSKLQKRWARPVTV